MKSTVLMLVAILSLLGCTSKKDTDYYKNHASERDKKIEMCQGKLGAFENDGECAAALSAEDIRPVSYWKGNNKARLEKLNQCRDSVAMSKTSNCLNAGQAETEKFTSGSNPVYAKP